MISEDMKFGHQVFNILDVVATLYVYNTSSPIVYIIAVYTSLL